MDSLVMTWRDATLRPRAGLARLVNDEPRLVTLLFSVGWGILQSLLQGARNNVGARGPAWTVLAFAIPIGTAWGLLQLHLIAGAIYLVARSPHGERIPFRRVRNVVALSSAPSAYALTAWLLGTLLLGRALYVTPETLPLLGVSPAAALEVAFLYLGTFACLVWSLVLLVLGIKNLEDTTVGGAVSTTLLSFLVGIGVLLAVAVVAVVAAGVFRAG